MLSVLIKSRMRSRYYVADILEWPLTAKVSAFCIVYHIFAVGEEQRDFKFGMQVDNSKTHPTDD